MSINQLFPARTSSVEETIRLGAECSAHLEPGDFVTLTGNLGSGKTHFVKGLAEGLGYDPQRITSPTFAIVAEHHGGQLDLFHFDAYRIKTDAEMVEIGFFEYLDAGGVCVLEWPEKIAGLVPKEAIRIRIDHGDDPTERVFTLVDESE